MNDIELQKKLLNFSESLFDELLCKIEELYRSVSADECVNSSMSKFIQFKIDYYVELTEKLKKKQEFYQKNMKHNHFSADILTI